MIIFDEEKYCEDLLKDKSKVYIVKKGDILKLARYFEKQGIEGEEFIRPELKRYILNRVDEYNEVYYGDCIREAIRDLKYKQLRSCNDIHMTKKEVEKLNTIEDIKIRKLLFMMMALAKFYKYNPVEKNKITDYDKLVCYVPLTEINKIGRLGLSKSVMLSYCHYLKTCDFIEPKWYGAYEIKIADRDFKDDDYLIKPDEDMIYFMNQFTKKKNDTSQCQRCHKWFRVPVRQGGKVLYCDECRVIVNREQSKERMKKYRQNSSK